VPANDPDKTNAAVQRHFGRLTGRTITNVRALTRKQSIAIGFDDDMLGSNPVLALTLDNGDVVIPMADPEGNGPGWLEVLHRGS